jgi:3-hydroxyisobutyrate dehydrogenase
MTGGDEVDLERCRPLLEAMGSHIVHVGAVGAGHAAKALNNMLSASGLVVAIEVLAVGARFGLDPAVLLDVLNNSSGKNNSTEKKIAQQVLSRAFGGGFSMRLMRKDLATAMDLAHQTGTPVLRGLGGGDAPAPGRGRHRPHRGRALHRGSGGRDLGRTT